MISAPFRPEKKETHGNLKVTIVNFKFRRRPYAIEHVYRRCCDADAVIRAQNFFSGLSRSPPAPPSLLFGITSKRPKHTGFKVLIKLWITLLYKFSFVVVNVHFRGVFPDRCFRVGLVSDRPHHTWSVVAKVISFDRRKRT